MNNIMRNTLEINRKKSLWIVACLGIYLGAVILFVFLEGGSIAKIIPTWNDEGGYYRQITSMLEYGHPLGYNGYDGQHAKIGNFGFHGMFILLPYYVWAKIWGWSYSSMAMCNIVLMLFALFILLCCIEYDKYKYFACLGCMLLPMVLYYTTTGMVESENYFFAVVLVAFCDCLSKKRNRKILLASGLVLGIAILCKITWAGMVFPIVFLGQRKEKKTSSKIINAFLVMILSGGVGYFIFSLFSSPYFTTLIDTYKTVFYSEGIYEMIKYILECWIRNIWLILKAIGTTDYGMWFRISAITVWLTLIVSIYVAVKNIKKKQFIYFLPAYIMGGYLGGVALLYTGGAVAIRTLYPAALMSMLILILVYVNKRNSVFWSGGILILTMGLGVFNGYDSRMFLDVDNRRYLEKIEKLYKDSIEVNEKEEAWDNTVAMYLDDMPHFYYAMMYPPGIANNLYSAIPESCKNFPKYALAVNEKGEWYRFLETNGYSVIKENDEVCIMMK